MAKGDVLGMIAEAEAFNKRITERVAAGFIPDLRRAVKCEYFYKSFWRDPHFIKLYLGHQVEIYLELLRNHGGGGLTVLDVGCGAGYISLELARAGYHVTGVDIAEEAIKIARKTLAQNTFKDGFGSLQYEILSLEEISNTYDVILFSGVLHHLVDINRAIKKSLALIKPGGLILCYEPSHNTWRLKDASQVALIRCLLSLTGYWYETDIDARCRGEDAFEEYAKEVYTEYVMERDKSEPAQSPHDNFTNGTKILRALRRNFQELDYRPGSSFIYRTMGGLRGEEERIHRIADALDVYEKTMMKNGYMRPNYFFFIGRKPGGLK